jgi:hypothetical protein
MEKKPNNTLSNIFEKIKKVEERLEKLEAKLELHANAVADNLTDDQIERLETRKAQLKERLKLYPSDDLIREQKKERKFAYFSDYHCPMCNENENLLKDP